MRISVRQVDWEFASVFRIAYRTRSHAQTVVVELQDGEITGRGEALGISYHGETVDSLMRQLEDVADDLAGGISREALQALLPAGGARNALDCALWDLEAKRSGRRVWELAGIDRVRPLLTSFTLGLDTPEAIGAAAAAAGRYSILKLKLAGDDADLARVTMARAARADAEIIVDANQAWGERQLHELVPKFTELGVRLIEQPMPAGKDDALLGFPSPIPLCADESCQTASSVRALLGKYQYVNIKLDKAGGLTESLRCARTARDNGFKLMVGCMGGSSLSMAPAFVVGQLCDFADLDGPLVSKSDVPDAIRYVGSTMFPPEPRLWG